MSEGKPRTRAAAPWDVAASICQGTHSDRPGLRGQCRRPAGEKGRWGHVERDSLKWVCQRLAAEHEACHLLQPPPSLSRHRGHSYCCFPAGCWGCGTGVGGRRPAMPRVLLAAGLRPAAQGCGHPQVLATTWKVLAFILQILGGGGGALGGEEACRSIIPLCFLTCCRCTLISSPQGRRGMRRSSGQGGFVTLWTTPRGNAF